MKRLGILALTIPALALAACGGSAASPTDKTPEGVMATVLKMRDLAKHDKANVICDDYLTASSTAMFKASNLNCGDLLAESLARGDDKDKLTAGQMSKTVTTRANVATFKGADGNPAKMLYVGGHWRLDLSGAMGLAA
jgi:hypothetical protein